jgi:hypothetical protein
VITQVVISRTRGSPDDPSRVARRAGRRAESHQASPRPDPAPCWRSGATTSLCDSLSELGGGNTANAKTVRTALELVEAQGVIIRLLWERTRPVLLDLRRSGVWAAPKWRTIPKETGDEAG